MDKDLQYFKNITSNTSNSDKQNIVVMGYNTWESIGKKPLNNRKNVVITKNHHTNFKINDYQLTIDNFVEWYNLNKNKYNDVYIIGGQQIYDDFMKNYREFILKIYITNVETENVDIIDITKVKLFNDNLSGFALINSDKHKSDGYIYDFGLDEYVFNTFSYTFDIYKNNNHINKEEDEYLNIMKNILNENNLKDSRNEKVYSNFGIRMEYNITDKFPLLTTKKVGWKTVLRELLWFISGSTNNEELLNKKVKIWSQNSEEYQSRSKYKQGDLGPIYGFQWRHFGAKYNGCNENYDNKGIDQLNKLINDIKTDPSSRRLIMSSWNPTDINEMALPPCHVLVQFYISNGYIDAQLYQRSGDMFLGVPFNIASYSFLIYIIGNMTGYKPRKLIHIIGDAHIYTSHIDAVKKQLVRESQQFPTLKINKKITDIDNINESDFEILNYNPKPPIIAKMIT
tara:strand:- start:1942 stop:3306 length:1365 start_codon:yes stop_codon:yes gene_type:complete